VALPPGREDVVSIGGELSLWHPLLADWLIWMHHECPEIALRAEVDSPTRLLDRVQEGSLDVAVLYSPPQRQELVAELLVEEKLVMVTSAPDDTMTPEQYIYVDWGPAFTANHQAAFPELGSPPVSISLGPLALTYLLTADGRLRRVSGTPEFSHSAYAVYVARHEGDVINRVLDGLRIVAANREKPGLATVIALRPPTSG
jgi:LysR family transcriptional regulator, flagellar master operon regulator